MSAAGSFQRLSWVVALALLASAAPPARAEPAPSIAIGARLHFSTWEGHNEFGGQRRRFEADGTQLGVNLSLRRGRFYTGVNLQGGDYDFTGGAPDQVGALAVRSEPDVSVERGEFDLFVGYYFWERVSLFLDLKNVRNEWSTTGFSMDSGGLGLGVSAYQPLTGNWLLFGNLGGVRLGLRAGGADVGEGRSRAVEIGFLYRLDDRSQLAISLKNQHQELDFDLGNRQRQDLGGLLLGYTYRFGG